MGQERAGDKAMKNLSLKSACRHIHDALVSALWNAVHTEFRLRGPGVPVVNNKLRRESSIESRRDSNLALLHRGFVMNHHPHATLDHLLRHYEKNEERAWATIGPFFSPPSRLRARAADAGPDQGLWVGEK